MSIYNAEHYADLTASIAVKRADKDSRRRAAAESVALRLSYLIGEVWLIVWDGRGVRAYARV